MSFDKPTRNTLAKMVAACRERLTVDISDQLQSTFGLYPDGTRLDVARTEADKRATAELRALLDYFIASDASSAKNPQNAYQRLVREIGFTTLNRLAALRLSEERGLVIECVRRGMDSDGFRLFDRVANGALGTRYATYRAFIEGMYDELALELPALFDRHHPHSHVFPGETALNETLALLNDPDLAKREIWKQDETIGWIYQYYNDPTERKKMRDESQAPRNSRELAVRNQFFTPRYVVEFLTDNTLGRIWFEMCGGNTTLAEMCRYLVKNSSGVRAKKDPRDLKILDPACGSGHFLLYAFDLLLHIYEEAWADSDLPFSVETGTLLREDYPDIESLRRAVPGLVLRYNLYGIDIDPRAAQIAALALWLRAQRTYMDLRLKPDERPVIQKTNIVTAEPMPGDPALLEDFLATVEVPFIQRLVREVFDKMALAGEAGSLLKIEEEIRDSIIAAKQAWLKRPKTEQLGLWQEERQPQAEQLALFEGITDESFWEQAEQRVLDALRDYARHAENGKGTRRRLFVEDAERGFAFIDILRNSYDVALMNPPFGEPSKLSSDYINKTYPLTKNDIYAAFIECWVERLSRRGMLGAITSRTGFFLSSFKNWRESVLIDKANPTIVADLGNGVLDAAMVETAAYCVEKGKSGIGFFIRLGDYDDKDGNILSSIESINSRQSSEIVFSVKVSSFKQIPGSPFCYWIPQTLLQKLSLLPSFETTGGRARQGPSSGNDERRLRTWWEILPTEIGRNALWVPYPKGGNFSPYYADVPLVVSWDEKRRTFKDFFGRPGREIERPEGLNDFFFPGLTWTRRASRFAPSIMPEGCIFGVRGLAILPNDIDLLFVLGLTNSKIFDYIYKLWLGRFEFPEFIAGVLQKLPFVIPNEKLQNEVSSAALKAFSIKRDQDNTTEISHEFVLPPLLRFGGTNLEQRSDRFNDNLKQAQLDINKIQNQIDELSFAIYNVNQTEKESIGYVPSVDEYSNSTDNFDEDRQSEDNLSKEDLVAKLISYIVGNILGRWDIRFAFDKSLIPNLAAPFSPLSKCSPGMLVSFDGFPARTTSIVSEYWLRTRPDAISLPAIGGTSKKPTVEWQGKTYPATIPDEEYPVKITWDGILVDDPGLDGRTPHPSDIVRRVRDVLEVLWKDNHAEIEAEACEILGVKDLRDYFRKPNGFFADHLKRYSKSRRQAPIYLPLSTPSGSYTMWIYYHRLSDEILFTAVNRYVDPKIEQVERRVNAMQAELGQLSGKSATETRDQLDELREFLTELRQFREELLRIANLPYKPDLNDGVILNAAPFHRLFRLNKWAKDTESAWKKLEAGEYDWAHIAYVLYPDRVRDVCKTDKSIAIAHGLESLYEEKEEVKKRKKKAKKGEEEQEDLEL